MISIFNRATNAKFSKVKFCRNSPSYNFLAWLPLATRLLDYFSSLFHLYIGLFFSLFIKSNK